MITTILQGRLGNQFYQIAMLLAYAKKHNLEYYIPDVAYHCDGRKMYFPHLAMGPELQGLQEYHEQPVHAVLKGDGTFLYNVPAYAEIPLMDNTKFVGYWQSFKYFDDYRDYILEKFDLHKPYLTTSFLSIHVRRGDFLQLTDKHPPLPLAYYQAAVKHFLEQDPDWCFYVFSDDIPWCRTQFTEENFPDTSFHFREGHDEYDDLTTMMECEHNILCYSTFGFIAAWLNKNPDKQVLIPPIRYIFGGHNNDMVPDYFTQLEFQ